MYKKRVSKQHCFSISSVQFHLLDILYHLCPSGEMQHSTVLVVLAALVVCCAADYGSVILFPFGRLRVEGHEHDNGVITGCDDCSTKAIPVHYNPVRIDGEDYEAFAVSSNLNIFVNICTITVNFHPYVSGPFKWLHHSVSKQEFKGDSISLQ